MGSQMVQKHLDKRRHPWKYLVDRTVHGLAEAGTKELRDQSEKELHFF